MKYEYENCCDVNFKLWCSSCVCQYTSCIPVKAPRPSPSRPAPSRQLQRWPEGRGGRMKRGGNTLFTPIE